MFDKSRALDITKLYLNKYDELKDLLKLQNEKPEDIQEDDLKVNSLLNIYIEPTNRCNFNCTFCVRENMNRIYNNISLEHIQQIINALPRGSYISLLGNGEPLLHPHIYDIVQYASEHQVFASIITNASALNEENRKKLIRSAPSRVQISFESIDKETNEQIMRGSKFERELSNILEFIYEVRRTESKILITISRVDFEDSAKYAEVTRKFWSKMPIDNYYEGPLLSMQTGSGKVDLTKCEEPYSCCANPWIDVKINSDGTVNPCVLDYNSLYIIGNVKNEPLNAIINSEKAIRFRKAVLAGDMEFLDSIGYHCGRCNSWTSQVGGSISGFLETSFPIRLGLVTNEVAGDRPRDTAFLERVLDYLRSGGTDILSEFRDELESF